MSYQNNENARPQTSQSAADSTADPFGAFKLKLRNTMHRNTQQNTRQIQLRDSIVPQSQNYSEDVRRVELSYLFNQ